MAQALMLRSDAAPYINGQATTAGVDTSGNSDQLLISNGAVGAAGIAFSSDPDSGMYRIGANNIGIAVNGAKVLDVATTGLSVTGTLGSSGALTITAGGLTVTAGGITISAGAFVHTPGAISGTPSASAGSWKRTVASTFTDSATAMSGTATGFVAHSFGRPTLAATNASVTTSDAANVYIANDVAAGTNETLTRTMALWVDAGLARFDESIQLDDGTRTATASGTGGTSTVTLSKYSGVITTDAITTAAGATHVITVTNTLVTAASIILATCNGTTSTGTPVVTGCVAGSGSFTITIQNIHASAAVNAALKVNFVVLR